MNIVCVPLRVLFINILTIACFQIWQLTTNQTPAVVDNTNTKMVQFDLNLAPM